MAAVIANTLLQQTPVPVGPSTGGGAAQQVAPSDATRVMTKLWSPVLAYWGGSGVTDTDGFPFEGETDWIPASTPIYVFCTEDTSIRWMKGT